MIKKILCTFLAVLLATEPAWSAVTYYLRSDGGSIYNAGSAPTGQCSGTADAPYPGSGINQACAVKSLYYLVRHGIDDTGTFSGVTYVVSGDTIIVGKSDGAGGSTDQFELGYNASNPWLTGCYAPAGYGCWVDTIPSGVKIYGRGYDTGCTGNKAQFWGTGRVRHMIRMAGGVDLQCVELTDHSACLYDGPAGEPATDGFPTSCVYSPPETAGPWAQDGITFSGAGNNVKNVNIHGIGRYGITTWGTFGNNVFENVRSVANGFGGFSTGAPDDATGTIQLLNYSPEWNGCGEHYPLVTPDLSSASNIHHCTSQGQNGAGSPDGFAFGRDEQAYPAGTHNAGNYIIKGGKYRHNVGDGIDTLHGTGNGTITIDRIIAEGNGGNQVKINASLGYLEHSKIMGNCQFFAGQPFTSTVANVGNSAACAALSPPGTWTGTQCQYTFASCRAFGTAIAIPVSNNSLTLLYNNTIVTNGDGAILSADHLGAGCNGTTKIESKNNIILGGWNYLDDSGLFAGGGNKKPYYYYAAGLTGNGDGTCGTIPITSQNNVVYDVQASTGCGGVGDSCNLSNPNFLGTIKQGHNTLASYYQATDYADQIGIGTTSPAYNTGVNTLTYQTGSNDYNNFPRTTNFDKGALEVGSVPTGGPSCLANGNGCAVNSDCCSNLCTASVCVSSGGGGTTTGPSVLKGVLQGSGSIVGYGSY